MYDFTMSVKDGTLTSSLKKDAATQKAIGVEIVKSEPGPTFLDLSRLTEHIRHLTALQFILIEHTHFDVQLAELFPGLDTTVDTAHKELTQLLAQEETECPKLMQLEDVPLP